MRPALLRMAIRYLEDSDEAEDAVQDVLLKLWFLRATAPAETTAAETTAAQ